IAFHNRSILPFLSGSEKLFLREKWLLIRVQLLNRELVMEKRFLIKWKTMQPYEYGPRKHNKRRVTV
ncbi:hypothetical protein Gotri_006966, partial [Gossypium trilobum]|nr:hypothetical protein [Gossypium trilobum]